MRRELRARAGGRRVLRRPLHGGGLSRRGQAVARVRDGQGAHVPRARGLARADGQARRLLRRVRRRAGARGRGRHPALRLVGRGALAGRLRGVRRAVVGADPRGRRRADDPLRHRRLDASARRWPAPAATSIGLDWRIALDDGWAARRTTAACRGTSIPAVLLGPWERVECAARGRARSGRRAAGPHLQPRARRAAAHRGLDGSRGSTELVQEIGSATVRRVSETAVILMAYGSPERVADVPAYYADIRGGRPIAPENLEDLVARYRALGIEDSNPLNAITEATRAALEVELGAAGLHRHEALDAAHRRPPSTRRSTPARRRSSGSCWRRTTAALSIAGYRKLFDEALEDRGELLFVESWHDAPGLIALLADRIRDTESHVVFTAHSLPARILDEGDPYRDQLLETARLVADSAGVEDWSFSFQSESPTGEPWLGPDILDHLVRPARSRDRRRARVSGRLRLGSSGDPLGHRQRGAGPSARARHAARPDRDAERRSRVRRTCWPRSCAVRSPRSLREHRPHRRRSRVADASASTRRRSAP